MDLAELFQQYGPLFGILAAVATVLGVAFTIYKTAHDRHVKALHPSIRFMTMNALRSRFVKRNDQSPVQPSMEELLGCLGAPDKDPLATRYLDQRPELRSSLNHILHDVVQDSQEAIEKAAYYRYLERMRKGSHPLDGREWEDWFAAENALRPREEQKTRVAAYFIYLERVRKGDNSADRGPWEDWFTAEQGKVA
jgi:hypothetical protein